MALENSNPSWNRRILINDESQLDFMLNKGIINDAKLSMPYRTRLTYDKSNLFLRVHEFASNNLVGYLKEGEDVKEAIPVNVYDKGGHEFEMMIKKFEKNGSYVLNRGWASFCDQHCLRKDDFVAIRTFRHGITDMLCFIVTYKRMR